MIGQVRMDPIHGEPYSGRIRTGFFFLPVL